MQSEVELLRSLDDEPDTPSRVDIAWAITAGRRRKMRRRAGYAGAATVTALAVAGASTLFHRGTADEVAFPSASPSPSSSSVPKAKPAYTIPGTAGWQAPAATAPTGCEIEQLPVPGGVKMALLSGADPTGHYQVGRSYPNNGYQAVIWHDGQGTDVDLPGDSEESLRDVNAGGTAVGWSYDDEDSVPFAYQNGKVSKLPGVKHGSAEAINGAGAITGEGDGNPVVWPSVTAKPIRLPVPKGTGTAQARDIDEDGTVVGSLDLEKPYVWFADGTHRQLPMPDLNGKPAVVAQAFNVRNGWATGMASPLTIKGNGKATPKVWAVRWNLRTGEMKAFPELQYPADDVNAQGWQISTDSKGYAVLVTDTGAVRLPDLAKHRADGTSTLANAISDDGRTIAGQSDDAGDTIRAVVWHCK